MWMDYNWSFTTQNLDSIDIYFKQKGDGTKVSAQTRSVLTFVKTKITLSRDSSKLFTELKAKIAAKLEVDPAKIDSIIFDQTDVCIEDDGM